MFGWDKVELGIVTKRLLIVMILLVIIAFVSFLWGIGYMSPSMIIPIPLGFGFWVFLQSSVFWVKMNGIIIFRINTAAEISLIALVFASLIVLFSFGLYSVFIYQLKRKGDYRTFGDANKRLKYIMVSGSKKERAVVFSSIIIVLAAVIYMLIFFLSRVGLVGYVPNYITFFFLLLLSCRFAIWLVIR